MRASLAVFRTAYPEGRNYLVCPGVQKAYERRFGGLVVRVAGTRDLLTPPDQAKI